MKSFINIFIAAFAGGLIYKGIIFIRDGATNGIGESLLQVFVIALLISATLYLLMRWQDSRKHRDNGQ